MDQSKTSYGWKILSVLKWFFLRQKYRFDLGQQFLTLLNLSLLIIAASDKLRYYTNINRTWVLLMIMLPLGFLGVWLFGFFLDKVVKYSQAYQIETGRRNPLWEDQKAQLDRIEKLLAENIHEQSSHHH